MAQLYVAASAAEVRSILNFYYYNFMEMDHLLIARIFPQPCGARKNAMQLVKYLHILSVKPSNKGMYTPLEYGFLSSRKFSAISFTEIGLWEAVKASGLCTVYKQKRPFKLFGFCFFFIVSWTTISKTKSVLHVHNDPWDVALKFSPQTDMDS